MNIALLILGIAAVTPIWRDPAWGNQGVNGIQALHWLLTEPPKEHIPVNQAIEECREAYLSSPDIPFYGSL